MATSTDIIGPASSTGVSAPLGVWGDSAGNVYISDFSGNRMKVVHNGLMSTIAGGFAVLCACGLCALVICCMFWLLFVFC